MSVFCVVLRTFAVATHAFFFAALPARRTIWWVNHTRSPNYTNRTSSTTACLHMNFKISRMPNRVRAHSACAFFVRVHNVRARASEPPVLLACLAIACDLCHAHTPTPPPTRARTRTRVQLLYAAAFILLACGVPVVAVAADVAVVCCEITYLGARLFVYAGSRARSFFLECHRADDGDSARAHTRSR